MAEVKPRVLLFDCYNTLLDIRTDEHDPTVWSQLARFLSYQRITIDSTTLHDAYFMHMRAMQQSSSEQYPEIDIIEIFNRVLAAHGHDGTQLQPQLAQLFRGLTICHLRPFLDTLTSVKRLQRRYTLGLVSDAQRFFIETELRINGLADCFAVQVISSDWGYRKPDRRLFDYALEQLHADPAETIYLGDNIYRDVCGAHAAGMRGVLIRRHQYQEKRATACTPDHIFPNLAAVESWLEGLPVAQSFVGS